MGGKGSGSKPREYPEDIVALACDMYRSGMTVAEIRRDFPRGYRVQTILERYLSERRSQARRNQSGSANHMWRGSEAGYKALHLRVAAERGKPSLCNWCGATEGRFEWANISGAYDDLSDYERLCAGCHRMYDAERRRITGRRTMPEEVR